MLFQTISGFDDEQHCLTLDWMALSVSCHWWNFEFYVQENKQVQENRSEHISKVRHEQADLSKAKSEHSNAREHLKIILVKNKNTSTQSKIDQDKLFE